VTRRIRSSWAFPATLVMCACIDLSTNPDEIVAIEFSVLPWPSIVAGDTLRDASGTVAPLVARLFDGGGDLVEGPVEFLVEQPSLRVVNGNLLVAEATATGRVGVFASTTGIQSTAVQVEVVPRPDSIAPEGVIVPLEWVVPDDPGLNTSVPISVRVLSNATPMPAPVRSWIVQYQLEADGRVIPANDTAQIWLASENGRPSYADTTDASGTASRRVRLRVAPGLVPPDSAVITVSASYKGMPLLRSPLVLVLPLVAR
jgi:hypothetical protein